MPALEKANDRHAGHRRAGHWRDRFVDGYVAEAARAHPDVLAVIDGETTLTYQELECSVRVLASNLAALGVTRGEVVSWQLPNWYEAVLLHHAVLRLGAISNPIIPIYRAREVSYILREARSRVVVVPETFRGFGYEAMIDELRPDLPCLEHVVVARSRGDVQTPFETLLNGDPQAVPTLYRTADDPILLMFTSGTTAAPKGVLHSHNTLDYENRSIIEIYGLDGDDVVFMPSPVTHITGMLYGLQLPAMLQTRVVLQDVWEPTAALQLIEQHRCSFTVAATPFLHGLVHHPDLGSFDVGSLRVFGCGGADVPSALIRDADRELGCRATRVYGSTEFPTLSTSAPSAPTAKRAGTDGRAIAAAEYCILDEAEQPVDAGQVGELLVRGPELFLRYLRDDDNADAFTEGGWFRTGDLATADDDGYVSIRGRKKDIVLRGGENISVTEVEDLLFEHPAVREVAIVAMPDPVMVERACAVVVPQSDTPPTLDDLAQFLAGKDLAKQKFPERLEIVSELPKTAAGKIQKFKLREQIREKLEVLG